MTGGSRRYLGGVAAGFVAWAFAAVDMFAHRGELDLTSALIVALGGIFLAVPRIENLRASIPLFGRTGVFVSVNDFEAAVEAASESSTLALQASDTAEEAAKLFESWLRELDALFDLLERERVGTDDYVRAVFRFVNTRLEDLSEWVGGENEDVRAALWWWSAADGGARIVAAPRIHDAETLAYVFAPGVGILGRVLVDGEIANLADAPGDLAWQRIARSEPRYRGLLCIPIVVRGRVAGALTVDRARAEPFGDDSVRFARQIVALVKLGAVRTGARGDVFSLPLPAGAVSVPPSPDSR